MYIHGKLCLLIIVPQINGMKFVHKANYILSKQHSKEKFLEIPHEHLDFLSREDFGSLNL
jgi:hypothetical protein